MEAGTVDEIYENWADNDFFYKITAVMDVGSPYSCEDWAGLGFSDIPTPLIDDGIFNGGDVNQMFNLFNSAQFSAHNHAILNHKMEVVYKSSSTIVSELDASINHNIAVCIEQGACSENICIYGDINGDGILNVLDVISMINAILENEEEDTCTDMNDDGIINVLDVVQLVGLILSQN